MGHEDLRLVMLTSGKFSLMSAETRTSVGGGFLRVAIGERSQDRTESNRLSVERALTMMDSPATVPPGVLNCRPPGVCWLVFLRLATKPVFPG